jgi:hypothetical protein
MFYGNTPLAIASRSIVCEVMANISLFINSTLPSTERINIYCSDIPVGALAEATQYYSFPANPSDPYPGIIDGLITQALQTGTNPYLNIPITFSNSSNFFHGTIHANVSYSNQVYMGLPAITSSTLIDYYTVMLHEVTHALGFASLIDASGFSKLGINNNYYSRFDQFLYSANGTPLLSTSTPSCPASNIAFTAPLSSIWTATSACNLSITTCSTAAKYLSSNVTATVATPDCFQNSNSLSHFEDMCSGTYLGSCIPTPTSPGANDLYYTMSNTAGYGPCYSKRYLKEEERFVLCDLGYSVKNSFQSLAVGANHAYISGSCTPAAPIYGSNDGFMNYVYTFTTTGSTFVITHTAITANDTPSTGLTPTCISSVYNNATVSPGSTDFTITATVGAGLVLIKYFPKNSSNSFGNATYIFIQFVSANCNPINACSLIQNGGFENTLSTTACGILGSNLSNQFLKCWEPLEGNPAVYTRSCTTNSIYNLDVNTIGTTPYVLNSFNGAGNDKVVALRYSTANGNNTQAIKNNLGQPLVPGTTYQLSFMICNATSTTTGFNDPNNPSPVVITVASNPGFAFVSTPPFPTGLEVLAQFTVAPGNSWSQIFYSITLPSTVTVNHSALIIGINPVNTATLAILTPTNGICCFIDEVSLLPASSPTFVLNGTNICGTQSFTDLAQYASNVPGYFSGPNVTYDGSQYHFNYPATILSPGSYPIAFTYTNPNNNCVNTINQLVTVSTNTNVLFLNSANLCASPYTLNIGTLLAPTFYYFFNATVSVNGTVIANPTTYTFTPGSIYTISITNYSATLCNNSATAAVSVYTTPVINSFAINSSISVSSGSVCSGYTINLLGTSLTATNYLWQPGNILASSQNFTPTNSTIYTLSVFNYSQCAATQTFAINVYTNCCYPTFTASAYTGTSLATTLNGPQMILNDITIPPNSAAALTGGEFLMAQTSKIIVSNNATLTIDGAHLYSCTDNLWQGIVVQNGGYLVTAPTVTSNLIEDAVVAIDISSHTNTIGTILTASNTIFNKNYTSINISNYNASLSSYPFIIHSNVFTCRTLSTTTTAWPQTGTVSAATNSAADLRYTSTGTLGLASPYLSQGFTITTLKNPYTTQNSNNAIKLDNVGLTSGNNFFGPSIGNLSSDKFNLFDAHIGFIDAVNSNLDLVNNTYQNTQRYNNAGGIAIKHTITAGTNFKLDLGIGITSVNNANRFWNCYYGIEGSKIYRFSIQYALFRSTQSSTVSPSVLQVGNRAINLPTNRFQYYMRYNEFTNISNCINMPITASWYNPCGNCISYGIYAANIAVLQNTFAATSGAIPLGNNFLNKALDIKCTNQTGWTTAPDYTASTLGAIGAMIQYNTLDKVFRGIYVEGMKGFPTQITDNTVNLASDNVFNIDQHAIHLANSLNANNQYAQSILSANTLSGTATSSASIVKTLVYSANNLGLLSPSVTCNNLFNCYQGFVFTGDNGQTVWAGNVMEPLGRGLNLITNGEIGQQGGPTFSNANKWKNTWSGQHTYVFNSNPLQSQLYVKNISGFNPSVNSGNNLGQDYNLTNAITYINSAYNDYNCIGIPNARPYLLPNEGDYQTEEAFYIAQYAAYKFLHFNDSVVGSATEYEDFYNNLSNSTIDKFMQMEELLYEGNSDDAKSINDAISYDVSELNSVEVNYNNFYKIYANFIANEADESLQPGDSASLIDLTLMCPETDGACVYQARALYNYIYHTTLDYNDCRTESARPGKQTEAARDQKITDETWSATLYPNPACDQVTIITNIQNEDITVMITDLSGRTVLQASLKSVDFASKLHFSLSNGAYLIIITNSHNEKIIRKLLVNR